MAGFIQNGCKIILSMVKYEIMFRIYRSSKGEGQKKKATKLQEMPKVSKAEKVLSMRRKSSKRCKTPEIANLDLAIHSRAIEKLSQILQEELTPIGRHLSK